MYKFIVGSFFSKTKGLQQDLPAQLERQAAYFLQKSTHWVPSFVAPAGKNRVLPSTWSQKSRILVSTQEGKPKTFHCSTLSVIPRKLYLFIFFGWFFLQECLQLGAKVPSLALNCYAKWNLWSVRSFHAARPIEAQGRRSKVDPLEDSALRSPHQDFSEENLLKMLFSQPAPDRHFIQMFRRPIWSLQLRVTRMEFSWVSSVELRKLGWHGPAAVSDLQ